jgi:hypothetical protein
MPTERETSILIQIDRILVERDTARGERDALRALLLEAAGVVWDLQVTRETGDTRRGKLARRIADKQADAWAARVRATLFK